MVVFNDTPMEEVSGVFFLTLLTSSSLCPHSLRHPCVLTPMEEVSGVFFLTLLTSSSLCPHSLRYPCVLTHMTCLLTHLIVIPDFSLTLLVLPLIPYSVFPHAPTLIVLTQVISSSSLATHSHDLGYQPHTLVVLTPLVLPLTHTSVLTHIVIPLYSRVIPVYSLT